MTDVPVIPMISKKSITTDSESKKTTTVVVNQTVFPKKKKDKKEKKKKKKEKEKEKKEKLKPLIESADDSGDGTVACTVDLRTKQLSKNGQYRIDALNQKRLDLMDWIEDMEQQNNVC